MPEPDEAAKAAAAEKAAEEATAAKAAEEKAAADAAAAKTDDRLTDADRKALEGVVKKERDARREADKALAAAQKELDELKAADLSEKEKAEKRAEEAEAKVTDATSKLRKANLMTALADKGLTGAKAKAASKLLDGVEYDEDDEPKNLDESITAATAEYGEDMFKGAARPAPNLNGGSGNEGDPPPPLTAEEIQYAKSMGMSPEEYSAYKNPEYVAPKPEAAATT
jgi:hypothetical protein